MTSKDTTFRLLIANDLFDENEVLDQVRLSVTDFAGAESNLPRLPSHLELSKTHHGVERPDSDHHE